MGERETIAALFTLLAHCLWLLKRSATDITHQIVHKCWGAQQLLWLQGESELVGAADYEFKDEEEH